LTGAAAETGWRVRGLELGLHEPEAVLRERAAGALGVPPGDVRSLRLARKSVDARQRRGVRRIHFVCHVDVELARPPRGAVFERSRRAGRVVERPAALPLAPERVDPGMRDAAVAVVGAGPAGLLAALVLAERGARVTLVDRGSSLRARGRKLVAFERTRRPDPESNLLFGEGGAGTYSDGKLYTRVDDPLEAAVLDVLVACGAPEEIRYDARAHIGTDRLHRLLPRLRERLAAAGVAFQWDTRVDGLRVEERAGRRRVRALVTTAGELPCRAVVLAPGHSARDTWQRLADQGVVVEPKPFQLGVRVEHPQPLVDRGRYGEGPEAARLGPAYYALVSRPGTGAAGAHSFCMCPGGQIVASVSEPGLLCTNGMSNSRHSSPFANAGLVTTLAPADFGAGAFDGVALQRLLEARFFEAGGSDYHAPAQRVPDFLAGRETPAPGRSSYRLGLVPGRVDALLPERVRDALRRALLHFDRAIPGFAGPEGLLVGIETRSAGPVRLVRDGETRRAEGFANLLPVGEGAGHAGGIMTAALDGAHAARALLRLGCD